MVVFFLDLMVAGEVRSKTTPQEGFEPLENIKSLASHTLQERERGELVGYLPVLEG